MSASRALDFALFVGILRTSLGMTRPVMAGSEMARQACCGMDAGQGSAGSAWLGEVVRVLVGHGMQGLVRSDKARNGSAGICLSTGGKYGICDL